MSRLRSWFAGRPLATRGGLAGLLAAGFWFGASSVWNAVRTEQRFREALEAEARLDFPAAARLLGECLDADPSSARHLFHAARVARREGDFGTALRLLELAAETGWPAEAIAWERRLREAQVGRFDITEPRLRAAVEAAPDDPDADLIREVLVPNYVSSFRIPDAYAVLHDWCERKPGALQPRLWTFDVARRLLIPQRAIEVARQAVELAPDHVQARANCAEILIENHQPAEAKAHFEWLLARDSRDPRARFGLAKCLRELGDEAAAARRLDVLLQEYPERGEYLTERGVLELSAGRPTAARDWLRRAVEATPFHLELLYHYSLCLERCGARDEAAVWRERHARAEADLLELKEVTKKIAAEPKKVEWRFRAGELMLRNGLEREGVRWVRSALAIDPRHEASRKALADYFSRVRESAGN